MKKILITACGIATIVFSILFINACQKSSVNDSSNSEAKYTIPTTLPLLVSYVEVNDQRTFLAWGLANAYFNPSVGLFPSSATPVTINLNASSTKQKVTLKEIVKTTASNSYLQPSSMSNPELGDAIEWSIQNVAPAFNLGTQTPFHPGAIIGFTNQAAKEANSYVEIVDYQFLTGTELARPKLVCPRNVDQLGDLIFPVRGYYYNSSTSLMAEIQFANEDDLEDQVTWLIHWVDYFWPTDLPIDAPNCDRIIACGDDFCDMNCGEDDAGTCPTECDMLRLKWLNWKEVKVEEDWKYKDHCLSPGARHREKFSEYNVVCLGIIEHATGAQTMIGSSYDVPRKKIKLSRKKIISCNDKSNNSSQVVYPEKWLSNTQKFDPFVDIIYVFFYEYDNGSVGPDDKWEYDFVMDNIGKWSKTFKVRSRHNPFGNLVKSETQKNARVTITDGFTPSQSPVYVKVITPADWVWDTSQTGHYNGTYNNLKFKFDFHS